jgi:hypothetical protein|nr:MAG TPA: hypothetical protein [Caudoviricetes sp.]
MANIRLDIDAAIASGKDFAKNLDKQHFEKLKKFLIDNNIFEDDEFISGICEIGLSGKVDVSFLTHLLELKSYDRTKLIQGFVLGITDTFEE